MSFNKKIMKKYKILFLLLPLCLFFSSCQDDTEPSLVDEVLSLDGESQKLAYRMLSVNERHTIWDQKMKSILENKSLSETQFNFVRNLKTELRPEYFEKNISERNPELYSSFKQLQNEAEQIFNPNELRNYFGNINAVESASDLDIIDDPGSGGDRDCNCNKGTDIFCPWTSTCEGIQCKDSESGCGWFWADPCNGVCAQVVGL